MSFGTARASSAAPEADEERKIANLGLWCGVAAFVTWFGMGVESILRPFQDNRREAFWLLPFFFTMVTFVCVHLVQRRRSRTEWFGFATVVVASALMLLGNIGLQLNIKALEILDLPL